MTLEDTTKPEEKKEKTDFEKSQDKWQEASNELWGSLGKALNAGMTKTVEEAKMLGMVAAVVPMELYEENKSTITDVTNAAQGAVSRVVAHVQDRPLMAALELPLGLTVIDGLIRGGDSSKKVEASVQASIDAKAKV